MERMKGNYENEKCPICEDKVSGYHYGLLTCESCKGFFKRTVQNAKKYSCSNGGSCLVTREKRKYCQACRFNKCKEVGMKIEAVRSNRVRGGRNSLGAYYREDRNKKKKMKGFSGLKRAESQQDYTSGLSDGSSENAPEPTPPSRWCSLPDLLTIDRNEWKNVLEPISTPTFHLNISSYVTPNNMETSTLSNLLPATIPTENSKAPLQVNSSPPSSPTSTPHMGWTPMSKLNGRWCTKQEAAIANLEKYLEGLEEKTLSTSPTNTTTIDKTKAEPISIPLLMKMEFSETEIKKRVDDNYLSKCPPGIETDQFTFMCNIMDQTLYLVVDWAKKFSHFSCLPVNEQMHLLHCSWIEILLVGQVQRQMRAESDEIVLITGLTLAPHMPAVSSTESYFLERMFAKLSEITTNFSSIQLDDEEFVCLKHLMLFFSEQRSNNVKSIQSQVNELLCKYELENYPQQAARIGTVMLWFSEIRTLALQLEEYIKLKLKDDQVPPHSLLMEMITGRNNRRLLT